MKAGYHKPTIEFEDFELNTVISAGCTTIITLGPEIGGHTPCDEYNQSPFSFRPVVGTLETPDYDNFYDDGSCSCYLSSVGGTLATS